MNLTYKFSNMTKSLRSLKFSFYFAMVGVCYVPKFVFYKCTI